MTFIVATNVIASRPPERRPTGTPHARAKIKLEVVATNIVTSRPLHPLKCRHLCQKFGDSFITIPSNKI